MEKKPFKSGDAAASEQPLPTIDLNDCSEPEIGLMVFGMFNISVHHTAENYSIYGTEPMLNAMLSEGPHAEALAKQLDFPVMKIRRKEIPLVTSLNKIVPRLAYVVKDIGEGQGVLVSTVHGTSEFVVPEEFVDRRTVPTPLSMIYHVPFGIFIFDAPVRIGYCHDLAIFFAEEHVRLLNHPFVKAWGIYHKSNPILRVRN